MNPRWDGDDRGYGVADARAFAGPIGELLHAANLNDWVAEAPERHLLPRLTAACQRPGSRFTLDSTDLHAGGWATHPPRWRSGPGPRPSRAGCRPSTSATAPRRSSTTPSGWRSSRPGPGRCRGPGPS